MRFPGNLPPGFEFLCGPSADLGLSAAELDAVRLTFVGIGVTVPGSEHRLRNVSPGCPVVEPNSRHERANRHGG